MNDIVNYTKELCQETGGHKLLYVTLYGSHLYGTANENSDKDYKFIFLPNKDFLLSGKKINHITRSSGSDAGKNSKDDVDIQGWSIQYFCELLAKGETNTMDVLYSYTNPDAVIFKNRVMSKLFDHHSKFYNLKRVKSFLGYANGQAKKYGIKGKRLKVLKNIANDPVLNAHKDDPLMMDYKLGEFIPYIFTNFAERGNCNVVYQNGIRCLHVNGTLHMESIKIQEFMKRIHEMYGKYGSRAEMAMIADGEDYKALSHAYRCFIQYEQLVKHGHITFPLYKDLDMVKKIKNGKIDTESLHKTINNRVDIVDKLETQSLPNKYDGEFVENFILSLYKFPKKLIV